MTDEKGTARMGDLFGELSDVALLAAFAAMAVTVLILRPSMTDMALDVTIALLAVAAVAMILSTGFRVACRLTGSTYQMIPERVMEWVHTGWRLRILRWFQQEADQASASILEQDDDR